MGVIVFIFELYALALKAKISVFQGCIVAMVTINNKEITC